MNIREASESCQVTPETIRYYEKIGVIPVIARNVHGVRQFDEEALKWIIFVRQMRTAGLPIQALISYLSLFQQGDETIEQRKALLRAQILKTEQKMQEMQTALDRLRFKLDNYETHMIPAEQRLTSDKSLDNR